MSVRSPASTTTTPHPLRRQSRRASKTCRSRARRALLERFPSMHDGWDSLGTIYEATGDDKISPMLGARAIPHGFRTGPLGRGFC
jgi:hypothetical protein